MTRKAAILPPTEPGRLLQEDEIEHGRRTLFPGISTALGINPNSRIFQAIAISCSLCAACCQHWFYSTLEPWRCRLVVLGAPWTMFAQGFAVLQAVCVLTIYWLAL